ncbi:heavy metal translocating P-type ATPase [Vagococcus luciliae]|uniref:Cd(2+)-exporting ATPase n=1 Tax=Vagococcus luciliae TaxID=2920380 RepID=A0ABY5NYT4_9ENTE|nr:heavy metal translocating P-type ATPase [Vagococcus luciliae]UUV98825.1 putative cadmium-transporting ATPase [Vagococcus luciliae]
MTNLRKFLLTIFAGVIALIAEFVFHQSMVSYWIVIVIGGMTTISMFIGMIKTLKSGKYGVDILAITAIVATLAVGQYWASLMVLVMLTGGDSLEDYAAGQAGKELKTLLDNTPQIAHKVENNKLVDYRVEEVKVGDVILVKPGEIVPVDGTIIEGISSFDESSLTGESRPIEKKVNDSVMSGSVNGDVAIKFKVTKIAADSQYQTIVKLVKESEAKPANFVRLADRYAVPFTIISYLIGGVAWFISKDPVRFAQVLVVASPCPLILAAPIALVAGMSRSSRHGVVVKTGTTIEKLSDAQSIAFDKTGTLTEGSLDVYRITSIKDTLSDKALIQLAASIEQESTHILARSLVLYALSQGIDLLDVIELKEVTGEGVQGKIKDQLVKVGKANYVADTIHSTTENTAVYVSIDDKYVGNIEFEDIVRSESQKTIKRLRQLGINRILMITGDNLQTAKKIGDNVGITEIHAKCLPQEKIDIVKELTQTNSPAIMVGDGMNDAPALAMADVGIAMGAHGSSAASESADAVILKDDLSKVTDAIDISKNTMKIAKQSVLIGIFICVILMLIASLGIIPTLIGAMLQEVVDTVSILSALRARKDK